MAPKKSTIPTQVPADRSIALKLIRRLNGKNQISAKNAFETDALTLMNSILCSSADASFAAANTSLTSGGGEGEEGAITNADESMSFQTPKSTVQTPARYRRAGKQGSPEARSDIMSSENVSDTSKPLDHHRQHQSAKIGFDEVGEAIALFGKVYSCRVDALFELTNRLRNKVLAGSVNDNIQVVSDDMAEEIAVLDQKIKKSRTSLEVKKDSAATDSTDVDMSPSQTTKTERSSVDRHDAYSAEDRLANATSAHNFVSHMNAVNTSANMLLDDNDGDGTNLYGIDANLAAFNLDPLSALYLKEDDGKSTAARMIAGEAAKQCSVQDPPLAEVPLSDIFDVKPECYGFCESLTISYEDAFASKMPTASSPRIGSTEDLLYCYSNDNNNNNNSNETMRNVSTPDAASVSSDSTTGVKTLCPAPEANHSGTPVKRTSDELSTKKVRKSDKPAMELSRNQQSDATDKADMALHTTRITNPSSKSTTLVRFRNAFTDTKTRAENVRRPTSRKEKPGDRLVPPMSMKYSMTTCLRLFSTFTAWNRGQADIANVDPVIVQNLVYAPFLQLSADTTTPDATAPNIANADSLFSVLIVDSDPGTDSEQASTNNELLSPVRAPLKRNNNTNNNNDDDDDDDERAQQSANCKDHEANDYRKEGEAVDYADGCVMSPIDGPDVPSSKPIPMRTNVIGRSLGKYRYQYNPKRSLNMAELKSRMRSFVSKYKSQGRKSCTLTELMMRLFRDIQSTNEIKVVSSSAVFNCLLGVASEMDLQLRSKDEHMTDIEIDLTVN